MTFTFIKCLPLPPPKLLRASFFRSQIKHSFPQGGLPQSTPWEKTIDSSCEIWGLAANRIFMQERELTTCWEWDCNFSLNSENNPRFPCNSIPSWNRSGIHRDDRACAQQQANINRLWHWKRFKWTFENKESYSAPLENQERRRRLLKTAVMNVQGNKTSETFFHWIF